MSSPTLIPMLDPQGMARMIPMDQVEAAKKSGGRVARKFQAPDGTKRWIPADQTDAAVKAGGKPVPLEVEGNAQPQGSPISRILSSAGGVLSGAVKGFDPRPTEEEKSKGLTSAYDYALRPFERVAQGGIEQGQSAVEAGKKAASATNPYEYRRQVELAAGHGLAAALPAVGPWAAGTGEQAGTQVGTGDYAGAVGTLLANAALAAAPKVAGKMVGGVARALPMVTRDGLEAVTKTSPRDTGNIVRDVLSKNSEEVSKAKAANETAAQKHLGETQEALHETEGRELEAKRKSDAAKEKADRESKEQTAKQIADREKTVNERRDAEEKLKSEQGKQAKIEPTQAKLKESWGNLRAGVETAREKALGVGNEKYSTVNTALNPIQADPEFMPNALSESVEALKGSHSEPTLLKTMQTKLERGDPWTYEDLQGDYSRLGKEISKGTLPGDEFHAYDVLHEAIGDEMGKIAKRFDESAVANGDANPGYAAKLTDARNYWRRMKQTFGRPYNPTDAATATMEKSAPSVATAEEQANRIRLLGSFDPRLPGLFEHIQNLQKGVKSLPEPVPGRALIEKANIPPVPRRTGPVRVEPEPVKPPERVAPPDRPPEIAPKTTTLSPQILSDMKRANMASSAESMRSPNKLASTFLGYDLLRNAFNALGSAADFKFGTAAQQLLKSVRDVGIRVGYSMGSGKLADLIERKDVQDDLSRITDRDIAELRKLPPDQQAALGSELKALVDAAPAKGVKVSPALDSWVSASVAAPVAGATQPKRPGDILPKTQ